jgi:cellobiose-specific phosphotransferase system component IIA
MPKAQTKTKQRKSMTQPRPLDPLDVMYPPGWVTEIVGMDYPLLNYYRTHGYLGEHLAGAEGPGNHTSYSLDQVLALATAMRFRNAGWTAEVVRQALQFVLDTGLEGIRQELEAGRRHLALGHPKGPQLIDIGEMPADIEKALRFDHANMALMLTEVVAKVKELLENPPPQGLGRRCSVSPKK